jgi:alkylation response protein AidB-like acyl-CoA dehydrogenase
MAMGSINGARTNVAAMACGIVDASLALAADYYRTRPAFSAPLSANQGLRWTVADIATKLEAARLSTYKAAKLFEENAKGAALAAAHAKKFAARMAQVRLLDCIQLMGANGLRREHGLGRQLACAKIAHYVDGSTEIQNERIAAILFD